MTFIVTERAQRPARMDETCFYCQQPIGQSHKDDCVLIHRKVRVRMTVEYEVEVPADWTAEQIERHRNHGSWCANNAIRELAEVFGQEGGNCMCGAARFEYVEDASGPYLDER